MSFSQDFPAESTHYCATPRPISIPASLAVLGISSHLSCLILSAWSSAVPWLKRYSKIQINGMNTLESKIKRRDLQWSVALKCVHYCLNMRSLSKKTIILNLPVYTRVGSFCQMDVYDLKTRHLSVYTLSWRITANSLSLKDIFHLVLFCSKTP